MNTVSHRGFRHSIVGAAALAVSLSLAVAGCSSPTSSPGGQSSAAGSSESAAPIADRPMPTDQKPDHKVKIAMIGFANNPYWVVVKSGTSTANNVLKPLGGSVDWIVAGTTQDVQTVNNAIRAAATQGYDGIGFFIAGEGNCEVVKELTKQGLYLGAYNTLFNCLESAGAVVNYAQEQTKAGQVAAKEMIKAAGDKGGSVGIITSKFTAPGAEQRRTGFIDGLKNSNLRLINQGVEAHDSAGETYTAAQSYLQSANDLVGIYATAGGPFGAAQSVKAAGKTASVKVIGYDITDENIAALRAGSMYGVIGQDAFGQGYNVAIELYNAKVTGKRPAEDKVLQPALSPFVTVGNLNEHDPAKLALGKLGAS